MERDQNYEEPRAMLLEISSKVDINVLHIYTIVRSEFIFHLKLFSSRLEKTEVLFSTLVS